jgi:hypothetical protein
MPLSVHMRCGSGETERLAFTLEALNAWSEPCVVRVLAEADMREVLDRFVLPPHTATLVRVPRRMGWAKDHARLSAWNKEEHVLLLEPGVRLEWEAVHRLHEQLIGAQAGAVVPRLYAMFEEQAGEEQWHERVASEQAVFLGVSASRGRLRSVQTPLPAGAPTCVVPPEASLWRASALVGATQAAQGSRQASVRVAQWLAQEGKPAQMSDAVGYVLAGAYRAEIPSMRYGWLTGLKWQLGVVV